MKTPYYAAIRAHQRDGCDDPACPTMVRLKGTHEGYLAALRSPEVMALVDALKWTLARPGIAPERFTTKPPQCFFCFGFAINGHSGDCPYGRAEAALAPWKGEAK